MWGGFIVRHAEEVRRLWCKLQKDMAEVIKFQIKAQTLDKEQFVVLAARHLTNYRRKYRA